ncbi:hypothetical protein [uncultured Roseobacter sp.]|uniref:hypothetical protein n=1 Tax=uncultured Roseobacter sp. TaxID=114847 RepID=UPI0026160CC2|nr:hypothetical protein [uncultured Roseobacter sp.]
MAKPGTPLFLERGSYRQRRMMDAVKLIAILGAGLWMIPLLWPTAEPGTAQAVPLSQALLYVFGVWWFLIAIAYVLARKIRDLPEQSDETEAM